MWITLKIIVILIYRSNLRNWTKHGSKFSRIRGEKLKCQLHNQFQVNNIILIDLKQILKMLSNMYNEI